LGVVAPSSTRISNILNAAVNAGPVASVHEPPSRKNSSVIAATDADHQIRRRDVAALLFFFVFVIKWTMTTTDRVAERSPAGSGTGPRRAISCEPGIVKRPRHRRASAAPP
jgi:hypothetical protein